MKLYSIAIFRLGSLMYGLDLRNAIRTGMNCLRSSMNGAILLYGIVARGPANCESLGYGKSYVRRFALEMASINCALVYFPALNRSGAFVLMSAYLVIRAVRIR